MKADKKLTSLGDSIGQEHGAPSTKPREGFEASYETFKLGVLLQQAQQANGLTKEGSQPAPV